MDTKSDQSKKRWRSKPSDPSEGPKPDLRNQKRPKVDSSATSTDGSKKPHSKSNSSKPQSKSNTPSKGGKDGTTPKKKVHKKRKPKKAKKVDKTRDFPGDLEEYLEQWVDRETEGSTWKFNKILQAWALDNCFNKKKVSSDLFKQLLPYLLSVQGGALDRLAERAAIILSVDKSDIVDDDQEVAPVEGEEAAESAENVVSDDDEEGAPKKKEIVTKSMAHRAKKITKGLSA